MTRERRAIVPVVFNLPQKGYVLIDPVNYSTLNGEYPVQDTIRIRRQEKFVYLIEMDGPKNEE